MERVEYMSFACVQVEFIKRISQRSQVSFVFEIFLKIPNIFFCWMSKHVDFTRYERISLTLKFNKIKKQNYYTY